MYPRKGHGYIWTLPAFYCRDLVAFLINCNEGETERLLVVCSASLPYDSEDPPSSRELRVSCSIAKKKTSV